MCCAALQVTLEATDKDNCFSQATVAREHGKKFTVDNRSGQPVCRVQVDKCLITSTATQKCDYLFKACGPDKYFLVELKGADVIHAVRQIVRTYDIVSPKIKKPPRQYKGIIVSSRVPAGTQYDFRRMQDKCLKEKQLRITKTHVRHTEVV